MTKIEEGVTEDGVVAEDGVGGIGDGVVTEDGVVAEDGVGGIGDRVVAEDGVVAEDVVGVEKIVVEIDI